jgi:hypothetical protein
MTLLGRTVCDPNPEGREYQSQHILLNYINYLYNP